MVTNPTANGFRPSVLNMLNAVLSPTAAIAVANTCSVQVLNPSVISAEEYCSQVRVGEHRDYAQTSYVGDPISHFTVRSLDPWGSSKNGRGAADTCTNGHQGSQSAWQLENPGEVRNRDQAQ